MLIGILEEFLTRQHTATTLFSESERATERNEQNIHPTKTTST